MKRTFILFLVAFFAIGTGLAFAEEHGVDQQDPDALPDQEADTDWLPGEEADADRSGLPENLYRVSEMVDLEITNDSDEQIGNVLEVVMNAEGEITHLIAQLDDLDGLESGAYLVPVSAISLNDESITVDAAESEEFTKFYDTAGADQLPEGTVRSSDFMDYDVVLGSNDEVVGNTYDVVVNLDTNRVMYVAISTNGFVGIGEKYHAIAFDQIEVDVEARQVQVDMTEDEFAQLEGFDLSDWPSEAGDQRVGAVLDVRN